MATIRVVRGQIERPLGEDLPPFEIPIEKGERVLTVDIRGGYMHSLGRPAVHTYTAIVAKESP